MTLFQPADEKLFFSKKDPNDQRLGDFVKATASPDQLPAESIFLTGYPDEEGIKLNGGRLGAALAPDIIRKHFYKMTPSLSNTIPPLLFDGGNIKLEKTLQARHEEAFQKVKTALSRRARVITLGGGHDYGFSDFAAFCEDVLARGRKPFVINFDAHLDVRPDTISPNSGTPFYRLLKKYGKKIDFFEVGIQDWCNSRAHLAWAKDQGAHIVTFQEIQNSNLTLDLFLQATVMSSFRDEHELGLSVDIDGFASSSAPGASQVFPVGLEAGPFLCFWRHLTAKYTPQLASFYEVSPPYDHDERTAKWAAILAHQFVFNHQ